MKFPCTLYKVHQDDLLKPRDCWTDDELKLKQRSLKEMALMGHCPRQPMPRVQNVDRARGYRQAVTASSRRGW
jgi:hypothetical protein